MTDKHSKRDPVDHIIDSAYESLTSEDGYNSMVEGWAPHLEALASTETKTSLLSRVKHHFNHAITLIDNLAPPTPTDIIATEISKSESPTIAVSSAKYLIAGNVSSQYCFGGKVGEVMSLDWLSPQSLIDFQKLLKSAGQGAKDKQIILSVIDLKSERPLIAEAYTLTVETLDRPVIIVRVLELTWTQEAEDTLKSVFKLTSAELSVSAEFMKTQDVSKLAEYRGASVQTVRKQLKSIFAKTNTNSQAQLYHFLSLIVRSKSSRKPALHDIWRDPLSHENIIKDKAGRKIAFTWMGHANGTPMILCHGSLTGYLFSHKIRRKIKSAKIKIYIICRPGFGNSDPNHEVGALEGARLSMLCVMDHLKIKSVPAIGLASGLVPLLYLAARNPGYISRFLSFGGSVPLDDPAHYQDLPRTTRVTLTLSRYAPQAARLAVRAGYRQVLKQGPSYMLQKIYGVAKADIKTTSDPNMLALLAASARMLVTHGTQTFERDLDLITYGWREDFEKSGLPLHVIQGSEDPVFLARQAEHFDKDYNNYMLEISGGAGQLVFLQDEVRTISAVLDFQKGSQ